MPASITGYAGDYGQTLEAASLFDRSTNGLLQVAGVEAASFLHNLCTNDIKNLPLGGGCEAYFCDQRAKALAYAIIYHVLIEGDARAFWLDVSPGFHEKLLKQLDRHLIAEQVELSDRSDEFSQLHLAGPNAKTILEKATREALPDLAEFQHLHRSIAGAACHIRRDDPLGVCGYEIICAKGSLLDVRQALECLERTAEPRKHMRSFASKRERRSTASTWMKRVS